MSQRRSSRWTGKVALQAFVAWLIGCAVAYGWLRLEQVLTPVGSARIAGFAAITALLAFSFLFIRSTWLRKVVVTWAVAGILWVTAGIWGVLFSLPLSILLLIYLPAFYPIVCSPVTMPKPAREAKPTPNSKVKQRPAPTPTPGPIPMPKPELSLAELKRLLEKGDYCKAVGVPAGASRREWVLAIANKKSKFPQLADLWTLAGEDTKDLQKYEDMIQTRDKLFNQLRRRYGFPIFEVDGLSPHQIWSHLRDKCLSPSGPDSTKVSQSIMQDAEQLVNLKVQSIELYRWQVSSGEAIMTLQASGEEIGFDIQRNIKAGQLIKSRNGKHLVRVKDII